MASPTSTTRRFEFVGGASDKFYEVAVRNCEVTVRFGRNGAEGQTQTKTFPNAAAAQKHAASQVRSKLAKGYVETP